MRDQSTLLRYYSLRRYEGEQDVDWPAVDYAPMPGMSPLHIAAMRCPLGLEPTPEAYIGHLVLVFREVGRVLRDDGVCWIVMGDSFATHIPGRCADPMKASGLPGSKTQLEARQFKATNDDYRIGRGLDEGNLMMIPHRLALALQADGWVVRNDCVWSKVSPMPESVSGWRWERCKVKVKDAQRSRGKQGEHENRAVAYLNSNYHDGTGVGWTDCPGCPKCEATGGYVLRRGSWRHTRAHETVLMCVKAMGYYADQERVREETADYDRKGGTATWECDGATTHGVGSGSLHQMSKNGRNPRSVLTPKPESYSGAHYAVFPTSLISPLIRASVPTRCCPVCGAPWAPVVEHEKGWDGSRYGERVVASTGGAKSGGTIMSTLGSPNGKLVGQINVNGYRPTCDHDADPIPGTCLDPFVGSGTTLAECAVQGVNGVGLDISAVYLDEHAKPRGCNLTPAKALDELPLFAEVGE